MMDNLNHRQTKEMSGMLMLKKQVKRLKKYKLSDVDIINDGELFNY